MPADQLVISATRLKKLDEGNMGGCSRKYAGEYFFGMREEQGASARFGEDFHHACDVYQTTGVVPAPESTIGKLLRSGAHFLRRPSEGALIESEHRGELPDGTEYVAYLDACTAPENATFDILVLDDQKTTSDAARALTDETLVQDLQAGFYSWVAHTPHLYRPKKGEGEWLEWVPNWRSVGLNWNYFLTRGSPRAWRARGFFKRDEADAFMAARIMPLVERAKALHAAFLGGQLTELNHAPHDMRGCEGVGLWCGAESKCDFGTEGLVQLRAPSEARKLDTLPTNTKTEKEGPTMGLAELRAKYGQKSTAPAAATAAAPAETPAAPPAPEPTPAPVSPAAAAPVEDVTEPTPAKRARKAPPAAPPGGSAGAADTINPPEAKEALAQIRSEVAAAKAADVAAVNPGPSENPFRHYSTEQLRDELRLRGYSVYLSSGAEVAA
jgi:hypothetical protein